MKFRNERAETRHVNAYNNDQQMMTTNIHAKKLITPFFEIGNTYLATDVQSESSTSTVIFKLLHVLGFML